MHCHLISAKIVTDRNRKPIRYRRLHILPIVLMFPVLIVSMAWADPYEVLVVDTAGAYDVAKIEEYKKDAEQFNSLQSKGYSAARPYFNVLHMANGQVYFVFGFKGEVQGVHRRNYPGTIENLNRMKHKGAPKYPHMHWLPVADIRKLLTGES